MSIETYTTSLTALVGALFFLLIMVLAWIGSRVHTKIDNLTVTLGSGLGGVNEKLGSIERDPATLEIVATASIEFPTYEPFQYQLSGRIKGAG